MATTHSPEGDIEEDEEIEWQKIAEAIDGIEKQYIDARNSVGGASAVPFLPQNAVPSFPSALATIQATRPPPTHPAPAATVAQEAPHTRSVKLSVFNPPSTNLVPTGFNVLPSAVSPGTAPQPATSIPDASLQNPTSDVVQLKSLLEQQRGSLTNHQNRIRSMQAELDLLRGLDVEKMRSDNARLSSALSTATAESARLQEQLSYVKQELASLRDRRRAESIAMGASNEEGASQVACTQVPGTQIQGTQKGDPILATTQSAPNHELRRTQAPWQSQHLPIRVPRRRKRTSASNEPNQPAAALVTSTKVHSTKPQKRSLQSLKTAEATPFWSLSLEDAMSTSTNTALRQHLFSGASGSPLWQLVGVAGQERLRDALLLGMGRDDNWPLVLEPMAALLKAGRQASLTALNCLYGLVVYSEQCQRKVATLPIVTTNVMEALKGAAQRADFTIAEKCLHLLRALLDAVITNGEEEEVVRIQRQLFSDDVLYWTRRVRTLPSSVLDEQRKLILSVRDAALSVLVLGATICMTSSSPPCDDDLRVLDEALTAASNTIRSEVTPPQAALSMVISAACHAPLTVDENGVAALVDACVHGIQTLRVADEHAKKREKRVRPSREDVLVVERERKEVAGMVQSCIAALALLSRAADLLLRKSERNVVLGLFAALAWPSLEGDELNSPKELRGEEFIKECRTVWLAIKKNDGI